MVAPPVSGSAGADGNDGAPTLVTAGDAASPPASGACIGDALACTAEAAMTEDDDDSIFKTL
mgnify:CR=1 FL=1